MTHLSLISQNDAIRVCCVSPPRDKEAKASVSRRKKQRQDSSSERFNERKSVSDDYIQNTITSRDNNVKKKLSPSAQ